MSHNNFPSARRFMAVGLVLGVVGLFWFAIVAPISTWRSDIAADIQRMAEERERLEESLVELQQESAALSPEGTTALVWSAPQLGEVTALVQVNLSNIARENDVSLRSITPLPSPELAGSIAVSFRLELEAPLDRLMAFLLAAEHHTPALYIELATLRRLTSIGETSGQPIVFAQIDVVAPILIAQRDGT